MLDRIELNEKRFNQLRLLTDKLRKSLDIFENSLDELILLNEYYDSDEWMNDFEALESGKIKCERAGVLSEDGVWNMNEDINEIKRQMENIIVKLNNK